MSCAEPGCPRLALYRVPVTGWVCDHHVHPARMRLIASEMEARLDAENPIRYSETESCWVRS